MDLNRVIGEVAARHGVRLDPDDPALVLVTVTELMLQQAQEEFLATARRATAEFVEAAGRAQEQAGAALAESARSAGGALCGETYRIQATCHASNQLLSSAPSVAARSISFRRAVWAVATGAALFLAGILVGRGLLQ